jgi:hypothetical protein
MSCGSDRDREAHCENRPTLVAQPCFWCGLNERRMETPAFAAAVRYFIQVILSSKLDCAGANRGPENLVKRVSILT